MPLAEAQTVRYSLRLYGLILQGPEDDHGVGVGGEPTTFEKGQRNMAIKTKKIVCRFIGDFKVGDNIARNARVLCQLSDLNEDGLFNKLMLIQAGSIMEAALWEIVFRAQNFNREGVPNISEADRAVIATKEIERFKSLIDVMKKYKILDGLGADVYNELDKLRKYRNRVHIQNDSEVEGVSRDEGRAFDDAILHWALAFNVRVLEHLNDRFPRPKDLEEFAHNLEVPNP